MDYTWKLCVLYVKVYGEKQPIWPWSLYITLRKHRMQFWIRTCSLKWQHKHLTFRYAWLAVDLL